MHEGYGSRPVCECKDGHNQIPRVYTCRSIIELLILASAKVFGGNH